MNQAVTNLVGNLGKSASFLCGGQARFFHQEASGKMLSHQYLSLFSINNLASLLKGAITVPKFCLG